MEQSVRGGDNGEWSGRAGGGGGGGFGLLISIAVAVVIRARKARAAAPAAAGRAAAWVNAPPPLVPLGQPRYSPAAVTIDMGARRAETRAQSIMREHAARTHLY